MSDPVSAAPAAPQSAPVVDAPVTQEAAPGAEDVAAELAGVNDTVEGEAKPEITPAEQKAVEKMLRKFKLKVDGQDIEEELDLNNEAELVKRLQMARMAPKAMQERANIEKNIAAQREALIKVLTEQPELVLQELGHKKTELAKKWLAEEMAEEAKTPEQKEAEKLRKELDDLRSEQKAREEASKKAEFDRVLASETEKIQNEVIDAMEALNVPKNNPAFLRRLADGMAMAAHNKLNVPTRKIAEMVKTQMQDEYRQTVEGLNDDEFEKFLGDKAISRVKANTLKKQKIAPGSKVPETAKVVVEEVKPNKISVKDFLKTSYSNKK